MVKRKARRIIHRRNSGDKNMNYVVASVSAIIAFALLVFILQNMAML